jgi:Protein of unknown function (DUF4231)
MSAEEYISQRVEQFQKWYDAKAIQAKSRYLRSRIIAVTGAAIVPVVANAIPDPAITRYATTIISLIVSLTVALEGVYHFGDQWKNYRSTEQLLSRRNSSFALEKDRTRKRNRPEHFLFSWSGAKRKSLPKIRRP